MSVSEPGKITTPWAESGLRNSIPPAADPATGRAGFDQGFSAINMTAKEAGGIPPFGQDFNGIFYEITNILRYMQAGGHPTYSSDLSTAIGGYPLGAMLAKSSGLGFWRNIVANNTTNPDSGGAGWVSDSVGSYANATVVTSPSTSLTATQSGQAFLFTTASSAVALPAPSSVAPGSSYKLHTSSGFTLSVTGGGAIQAGSSLVSSITIPAGTEVLAVSSGASWWVFGTGQTLSTLGLVGGFRNLKLSATGLSAEVAITVDQIALDSTIGAPALLASAVSVSPSISASGVNGLDAGSPSSNAWYSVWVISNGVTTAGLFSLSTTAPTMPAGYTYRRRVGWMRSDVSINKHPLAFRQRGELVEYTMQGNTNYYPTMVSGAVGTITASSYTPVSVSVDSFVPPSTIVGIRFKPHNPDTGFTLAVTPVASSFYGGFDSATPPDFIANPDFYGAVYDMTLASRSIYVASGSAGGRVFCVGWRDAL